jgi:hypothetical protein
VLLSNSAQIDPWKYAGKPGKVTLELEIWQMKGERPLPIRYARLETEQELRGGTTLQGNGPPTTPFPVLSSNSRVMLSVAGASTGGIEGAASGDLFAAEHVTTPKSKSAGMGPTIHSFACTVKQGTRTSATALRMKVTTFMGSSF